MNGPSCVPSVSLKFSSNYPRIFFSLKCIVYRDIYPSPSINVPINFDVGPKLPDNIRKYLPPKLKEKSVAKTPPPALN